jgi:HAD superfamily hydrolase (TIGR01549 family)
VTRQIDAIFLDIGNTLRILEKDPGYMAAARQRMASLIGIDDLADEFGTELEKRYKVYRKWAFENLVEASEEELWTRWMAPEFSKQKIAPLAHELTYEFRQSMGRRVMAEGCKEVIVELYNRGYILGIISNVITTTEIPDWMEAEDLNRYFSSVLLSSTFGRRKPHSSIYLEAARRAGVEPVHCVYVGDNYSRDVAGTREAGFGMVVIMPDLNDKDEIPLLEHTPDLVIHELRDLLTHFPGPGKEAWLGIESISEGIRE